MRAEIQTSPGNVTFYLDRPVEGLKNAIGSFYHGLGPGPEGPERPIPLFLQVLEAKSFDVGLKPGDPGYQVLSNDQNRFALPKALPPVLSLLAPGDDDNPTADHVVTRYAYSEGAFQLLHDLLETGFRFTLKEFLWLAQSLGEVLAFLHSRGIVHGQWNPRSILCIPETAKQTPFDDNRSYRYHVLNTGVVYQAPEAIPREFLERGYFPREVFPQGVELPDYEAYDLETDVYCLAACLKDIFQRASCFEELTTQAKKIRDFFLREAIRRGQEPTPDRIRHKEQEILDHLYTIKVKAEEMIQSGLRERGERSIAAALWAASRDLYKKVLEYSDKLFEVGFGAVNIFGKEMQRYVPYQIKMEPRFINSFEETLVTLHGTELPYEVVRLTLGDSNSPLEVLEGTSTRIRFRVAPGFAAGEHQVLINNQRTSETLKVIAPTFQHVLPEKVRRPWQGFGDIVVRVVGRDFPSGPTFTLAVGKGGTADPSPAEEGGEVDGAGAAEAAAPPGELLATLVHPETAQEEEKDGFKDERINTEDEVYLLHFPPDAPVGIHPLMCKGLLTGLQLMIEEALPDPMIDQDGISPVEVLNHREQMVHLRGRSFHETMVVDLGEAAATQFPVKVHYESDRSAVIALPPGFPAGQYPLRVNKVDSGLFLVVREPRWASLEPRQVVFGGRRDRTRDLIVRGESLPALDEGSGQPYRMRTLRGRELPHGVLKSEEVEPGSVHRLSVSPELHRGSARLFFETRDTGLQLRVYRKFSPAARAAASLVGLLCLSLFAFAWVEHSRPRIEGLLDPRVFNFGASRFRLTGERIREVVLRDKEGRKVRTLEAEMAAVDEPGAKAAYSFSSAGIPAGIYTMVPVRGILAGKPSTEKLEVLSPRFELSPGVVNRLLPAELTLVRAERFPAQEMKLLAFRALPQAPPAAKPEEKKGGEEASSGLVLAAFPPKALEGKAPAKAAQPPEVGRAGLELALSAAGKVQLKTGAFTREQEGEYEVSLNGIPLSGDFTASTGPLTLRVVGPRNVSLAPNPATLGDGAAIRVGLKGENVPAGVPLCLLREGKTEVAFRLKPVKEGFEGPAEPGKFLVAWDLGQGKTEVLPGVALTVHPPPQVLSVSPPTVEPGVKVELTLKGVNLREARSITMKSVSRSTDEAITFALDRERLRQDEAAQSEYQTEPLAFETGKYAVFPGDKAFLEVIEDCKKLLEAYRKDQSERDRLVACLADGHAREEVRSQAADVFFDQGLFAPALGLYRKLPDLKSRFRAAFLSRYLPPETPGREEQANFTVRPDDTKSDPYYRAAVALGWIAGQEGAAPADLGGTWDVDFVRGSLAEEPRAAVEALELSIEKKKTAALAKEIEPFAPAHDALAAAKLRLIIAQLREGDPARVREDLRTSFFDSPVNYGRLSPRDRARACFFHGHVMLWTWGDEEKAGQAFAQGVKDGESSDYALASRLYQQALAGAAPPGPSASAAPGWEGSFIAAYRFYRHVRAAPNYNILTEKYDFGSPLYPEERKDSLDLHQAIKRLESAVDIPDPFAHHALLYFLRSAQLLSWPQEQGGLKAREHEQKLLSLKLGREAAVLRDFYLLEGAVVPLESAQLALLPYKESQESLKRVGDVLKAGLGEPLHARLKLLEKKLQKS